MSTIYHTLNAYLYENHLIDDAVSYYARIVANRSLSFEEVCESAVSRGGSTMSVNDIKKGAEAFFTELSYLVCDGYSVSTDWLNASLKIVGTFDKPHATFDDDEHKVKFAFTPGTVLRNELKATSIEMKGLADSQGYIDQVVDMKTGNIDSTLTVGRNLKIVGDKIKIVGDDASVGVYFINSTDETVTRVDDDEVVQNTPSEVLIMTPELAAGDYTLRIVTQYARTKELKTPRTLDFDKTLTVS